MRESYSLAGLSEADLAPDWLTQFRNWLAQTVAAGLPEPNAMVVATATPSGEPASRAVLAKAADTGGVVFYTNLTSDKSRDLPANPRAAATFPWIGLQRQVHFRGTVSRVSGRVRPASTGQSGRGRHRSVAGPARSRRCWPIGPRWRCLQHKAEERFGAEDSTGDRPSRCRRSGAAGGSHR